MTYLWLATWLILTLQILIVAVFVMLTILFTRTQLDVTVGPIPSLPGGRTETGYQ